MQITYRNITPLEQDPFRSIGKRIDEALERGVISEACLLSLPDSASVYLISERECTEPIAGNVPGVTVRAELQNRDAVRRFYLDAIGAGTALVGEETMLDGVKDDFAESLSSARAGPVLRELFDRAIDLGREICRSPEVRSNPITPPGLSGDLAGKIMEDISEAVVAVLGGAADSGAFVRYWERQKVRRLYYSDPDYARAEHLAAATGAIPVRSEERREAIVRADVIIQTTETGERPAITPELVEANLRHRKQKHLLIYNWGGHRELDPAVRKSPAVFVYAREELDQALQQARTKREQVVERFRPRMHEAVEDFYEWLYSEHRFQFHGMVGASRQMQQVFELIHRVAETDITVLVQGETGTGKELVARAIHEISQRRGGPFVTINCGAIPETLLESELFGHRKGAFTGADLDRKGLLKEAAGGTVFLDEIGETSQMFQVKLLRALQEREITPLGSNVPQSIDVRIIAATSRNLREEVERGNFRSDLYYRINVVTIQLPPLRARKEDILPLVRYFIKEYNAKMGKKVAELSDEAAEALLSYRWKGNVRELENVVERAIALSLDHQISLNDLPDSVLEAPAATGEEESPVVQTLEEMEKQHIQRLLRELEDNYNEVAEKLGIGRTTLWRKMKKYGLEREE